MLPLRRTCLRSGSTRPRPTPAFTPVVACARLRPFASTTARLSSEAVEIPHSATPQPKPEEKATELHLPAAADDAPPRTGPDGEDGSVIDELKPPQHEAVKGQVYVSGVFPVQLGKFDPRPFLSSFQKENLLDQFSLLPSLFPPALDFKLLAIEKQPKAGGVFLTYSFTPRARSDLAIGGVAPGAGGVTQDGVIGRDEVERELRTALEKNGGVRTWNMLGEARVWRVQGRPWHEDLNRFPASQVKVSFVGPDLPQESLYDLLRRYGHISTMTAPTPQPAGTARFSLLAFSRLRSSVTAVSCLHGITVPISEEGNDSSGRAEGPKTTLKFEYQSPIKAHAVQDWISSHPRIALPVLAFLLGTFSYTVFDPIREFMVSSKILNRFSWSGYPQLEWLRSIAESVLPAFIMTPSKPKKEAEVVKEAEKGVEGNEAWEERREAEKTAEGWLREYPSGFIVVAGPHGSGKTALVEKILNEEHKKALVIDCAAMAKSKSDADVIQQLARQTGYWPLFGFLSSLNHLIDLGAMGLIGQKAGFSTDFPTQVKQVLDVVTNALKQVVEHEEAVHARQLQELGFARTREAAQEVEREKLKRVGYHDPRLDALAGNGIMSELGYGDEPLLDQDVASEEDRLFLSVLNNPDSTPEKQDYTDKDKDHIESLPVVVLKDFAAKGSKKDELWSTIADWAAGLVDAQIAQVVIVSENATSSGKLLTKALASKPMNTIMLADADPSTALSFVAERLGLSRERITAEEKALIGALGGRQTDLEGLVYKVKTGLSIKDAMDDIINKSQMELRKALFGDDSEEAKSLSWTRAQAWTVVSKLAGKGEVPYSPLLLGFPFKGAEDKLRKLEAAEYISITSINGRPSTIRPGKPMYHAVFRRLVDDPVFHSAQVIDFNNQVLASNEAAVKACEDELLSLNTLEGVKSAWIKRLFKSDPIQLRAAAILDRMKAAQLAISNIEKENGQIKGVLSKHV